MMQMEEERFKFPDLLVVLADKHFESPIASPAVGVEEGDSNNKEGKGFFSAKLSNSLGHAKAYKRKYDNLPTGKKVLTTLSGPVVATGISLKSSIEKAKPLAIMLEREVPGLKCFKESEADRILFSQKSKGFVNLTVEDKSWKKGVIFRQHPKREGCYIQMKKFHDYIMKDKEEEFLKIMIEIGAKTIKLSKSKEFREGGMMKALSPRHSLIPYQIGGGGGSTGRQENSFGLNVEMSSPGNLFPRVSRENYYWLDSEPTWKAVSDLRMSNPNIARLEVTITSVEDYGVNPKLEGKIKGVGLGLDGSISAFRKMEHYYEVTFFTTMDYEIMTKRQLESVQAARLRSWSRSDAMAMTKILKLEGSGMNAQDGQDLLLLCGKENGSEKLTESMKFLLEHPTCPHPPLISMHSARDSDLCEICLKRKRYSQEQGY